MSQARKRRLSEFVSWVAENITGDEKGEAQIFVDRLFQAFGQRGCLDVGGKPEFRVRKRAEDGGGVAFADYVWKPIVLIEMKKRGTDLAAHYRQAFDYWVRLVPDRPRWVALCNFDEFWVYDFETQMDTPVDRLTLTELPDRWGPLAFLFPTDEKPTFGNDHEAVTRKAADLLARCFNKLVTRNVDRAEAQRFILQMLVALFAEDIGLLDRYFVARLLDECEEPADSYDLLGGLFAEMNRPGRTPGGRFKGVDYFNGGLFSQPAGLEIYGDELNQLNRAAQADWSKVRPEIFGTLFEHSLDKTERHAFGAHFTHPIDIMKIVGPTIVEPWRDQIAKARTIRDLHRLLHRMQHYTVLDPACGSGNFLYLAYRELKRLEVTLYERINQVSQAKDKSQPELGFVTARQFFGIDINPFAVEIAKVTMMIARKLAIDELNAKEPALPLDNLDDNFTAADALIDSHGAPVAWPPADVIIGNPPFLGAKRFKPERGPDYVNAVRKAYPDVPGMADYCVYWFRKANDHLPECTADDPLAGRAGLVGTQNVRNNQSRVGGLDHVVETGTILEAVDNQPWSGESNVHVSIVNWIKTHRDDLLPEQRKLWFKVQPLPGIKKPTKPGEAPAHKQYELNFRLCPHINSTLSDQTDVSAAHVLSSNAEPQCCFTGQMIGHAGFLLTRSQRDTLVAKASNCADVTFPYLNGREFLTASGFPDRYVLDFGQRSQLEAAAYTAAFEWVRNHVLPDRQKKYNDGIDKAGRRRSHHKQFYTHWWQLSFSRPELIDNVARLARFIVCSRVTKRPVFVFVSPLIRPGDALSCFCFEDNYSFGVLQSNAHWQWFVAKCSKLKSDFRYTPESVFDTFPWPQSPSPQRVAAVAHAGRKVRRIRAETLPRIKGGLRALYRTLELPGNNPLKDAHAALDRAVLDAYGFSPAADLLAQLLALNLQVAKRIDDGQPVTAPGIPTSYPNPEELITDDCIHPDPLR